MITDAKIQVFERIFNIGRYYCVNIITKNLKTAWQTILSNYFYKKNNSHATNRLFKTPGHECQAFMFFYLNITCFLFLRKKSLSFFKKHKQSNKF